MRDVGLREEPQHGNRMMQSKLVWPITAIVCAAIVSGGLYFGLRDSGPRASTPQLLTSPGSTSDAGAVQQAPPGAQGPIVYATRTGKRYHRGGLPAPQTVQDLPGPGQEALHGLQSMQPTEIVYAEERRFCPVPGRLVLDLKLDTKIAKGDAFFRKNADFMKLDGTKDPWIYASGCEGLSLCTIPIGEKGGNVDKYTVRLHFMARKNDRSGQRVFDVSLQDRVLLKEFDIVR